MFRRRLLLGFTVATTLLVTNLQGCSQPAPTDSAAEDTEPKTLIMGTSADYPPYEFYETAKGDGDPVGFDIAIAKAITSELGYDLEIKDMDFNGIIPALQSGRIDFAMAGLTPTAERKESIDFSTIYYDAKNTIVAQQDSGLETYEDLVGKKVGVQLGTIQQEEAEAKVEEVGDITLEPRNKISELIQEIKAGRLDAAIIEDTVAKGYVVADEELMFTDIESDGESGSAIAFPKDSELTAEFDAVLTDMIDSGKLEPLIKKWFEDYYDEKQAAE